MTVMEHLLPYRALEIIIVIAVVLLGYYRWAFQYWKNRKVPCARARFPLGSMRGINTNMGLAMKQVYDELKGKGAAEGGLYLATIPAYMPISPEITKRILLTDFDYFSDRGYYHNEDIDPLSENLVLLDGQKWRTIRDKLSPAFTPMKLKAMFNTFLKFAHDLHEAVDTLCEEKEPINLKYSSDCYTIDSVGSSVFGVECNSFKNPNAEFKKEGMLVFEDVSPLRYLKITFALFHPQLAKWLRIRLFEERSAKFFFRIARETVASRETNQYPRKDLMQIIMDLEKSQAAENKLTIKDITANAFALFMGGYETSSSTITFGLYEFAKHPDIQERLRKEIQSVIAEHNGEFTYDAILNMTYLNQIYEEILRKYPAINYITRKCVREYRVPTTKTVIEKGTFVIIPLYGIHHDAEYYPDPGKFNPERFTSENKQNRPNFTFLPYGEGPRHCIGIRYAVLAIKVAWAILLKDYAFSLDTRTNTSFEFRPRSFVLVPKQDIYLQIEKV